MDVTTHVDDRTLTVSFDGRWSVAEPVPEVATTLDDAFEDLGNGVSTPPRTVTFDTIPVDTVTFDTEHLEAWDSTLLVFLLDLYETAEDRGWDVDDRSLPDDIRQLLTLARAVPEREAERDRPPETLPAKIGEALLTVWDDAWYFVQLTGEVTLSAGQALVTRSWQGRDFRWVLQNSTASALPIATLDALQKTMQDTRQMLSTDSGIGYRVEDALANLSEAAEALRVLAISLERDPSTFIRGKEPPDTE